MNEVTVHIVIVVGVAMALIVIIVAMGVTITAVKSLTAGSISTHQLQGEPHDQ
jgi:hypothetical protein